MGASVLSGLRHHEAKTVLVVLVVGNFGDLVHVDVIGQRLFLTHYRMLTGIFLNIMGQGAHINYA